MKRRDFIRIGAVGMTAAFASERFPEISRKKHQTELDYHTVAEVRFTTVKLRYPRLVGKNSQLDVHGWGPESGINILYTNKGASGWGLNKGSQKELSTRSEMIKGRKISELLVPETGVTSPVYEGFDFSLYDLAGKILRKPVYRLLGKRRPETQLCYSGMIYFDDLEPAEKPAGIDKILEECRWDYNYGYRQFKLKIGRGNKWMTKEQGLKRDIEVTKLVAANFPGCDILVDGNNGFTVDEFIKYLEGIGDIRLFWIEEPFHETIDNYAILWSWMRNHNITGTLLADGEAKPDQDVLTQLRSQKIVKVALEDIQSLGFTNWISLIKDIRSRGLLASPHNWGSAIKTSYTAHLAGAFGATATIEGVTCTSDDVDLTGFTLKKGRLIPPAKPGFGMDLLKKV